jgi:hypothetical protein
MLSEDDIFEKFPENRKMYDIQALGCHPDYRGRGIASELTRQGFQVKWSPLNEITVNGINFSKVSKACLAVIQSVNQSVWRLIVSFGKCNQFV